MNNFVEIFILLIIFINVTELPCWKYFTNLNELILTGSPPDQEVVHSEYTFGDCTRKDIILFAHVHKDHMEVLGKIIIREWLDLKRIPTCIILRANSYEVDTFRSTTYNFQICVPRITYCHSRRRYKYFFYEWYLPLDMVGGMNWDIFFYGPENLFWQ